MSTATQSAVHDKYREYETIYVMRPDASGESITKAATRLEEVAAREGAKLTLVENWGRRQLAYTVGKFKRGIYSYIKYVGKGKVVTEIERNLRLMDDVILFQSVQVRDEVDFAGLSVDPEAVKFQAPELIPDTEEQELTLAQVLGLEALPGGVELPSARRRDDDDFDDDGDMSDDAAGEEDDK